MIPPHLWTNENIFALEAFPIFINFINSGLKQKLIISHTLIFN